MAALRLAEAGTDVHMVERGMAWDTPGTDGQDGGDVVGGRDPERAAETAEFARVTADLGGIVYEDGGECHRRMGSTARIVARPTLPVPQTTVGIMRGG